MLECDIQLNESLIERLGNGETLTFETPDKDKIVLKGVKINKVSKKSADIIDDNN